MQAPSAPELLAARRIWQLLNLNQPALALAQAAQVLAQNPTSVQALWGRTEALRQLGRLPEALTAARQGVAQAPQSAALFAALARVYGQQGQLWPAVDAIQESLRLNPMNATSYALLAELQYLLHRPDETVTTADSGLFLDARHTDCLLWRALAQEQLSQPAAADHAFQQLLRLAPNSSLAHAQRGKQLLRRCELHAAEAHLAAALRLAPTRSTDLVPLLRRARREQHWPGWLVGRRQQLRQEWQGQHVLSYRGGATLVMLPIFWVRGWWRTRHDPLFRLSPAQLWQLRLKLWLALVIVVPVLAFLGDYVGLFDASKPLSMPQMLGLAAGGLLFYLSILFLKKQIDKHSHS
ncbi:tetratricopeptide repeat protein [Hymenobacter sp. H14-R3]|uniref:tetratricopeptide repeat protein n=1 Tax=Hymenobacter sp. H14-R3 TaxID=3046308 RepID=UPI0024BA1BE5|nr:tetratricopeptide repeat protein [Hymenobacter sp. H14-R3]MDJ0365124.1 tetratricopeptide repeat protein [Hymenobacter sp. H14-R3]